MPTFEEIIQDPAWAEKVKAARQAGASYDQIRDRLAAKGVIGTPKGLSEVPPPEGEVRATPTLAQKVGTFAKEQGPTAMAATVGGLAGGIPGAALAGGAARGAQTLVEGGTTGEAARAAGGEALMQTVGGTAVEGGLGIIKGLIPSADVAARSALEYLNPHAGKAVGGLPKQIMGVGEATNSFGWTFFQNIGRSSIFQIGKGGEAAITANRAEAIGTALTKNLLDQFGPHATDEHIGEVLLGAVKDERALADAVVEPLYNTVRDAVTPKPTTVQVPKQVATGILDQNGQPVFKTVLEPQTQMVGGVSGSIRGAKEAAAPIAEVADAVGGVDPTTTGESLAKTILAADTRVSVDKMMDLRSALLSLQRKATAAGVSTSRTHAIGEFVGKVDGAIEESLTAAGRKDVLQTWRDANRLTKANAERLRNEVVNGLMDLGDQRYGTQGAAKMIDKVFVPGDPFPARQLMTAIAGNDPATDIARQGFLRKLTQLAKSDDQIVDGAKLKSLLEPEAFGNTAKEVLLPAHLTELTKFAEAVATSQRGAVTSRGSLALAQHFALVGALTGYGSARRMGAVVIAPAIMERLLDNPLTARLLTRAIRAPATTKTGQVLAARVLAAAGDALVRERQDEEKRYRATQQGQDEAAGFVGGLRR